MFLNEEVLPALILNQILNLRVYTFIAFQDDLFDINVHFYILLENLPRILI